MEKQVYIIILHIRLGQKENTSFSRLLPGSVTGEMRTGRRFLKHHPALNYTGDSAGWRLASTGAGIILEGKQA